jgi:hypothetical protein
MFWCVRVYMCAYAYLYQYVMTVSVQSLNRSVTQNKSVYITYHKFNLSIGYLCVLEMSDPVIF